MRRTAFDGLVPSPVLRRGGWAGAPVRRSATHAVLPPLTVHAALGGPEDGGAVTLPPVGGERGAKGGDGGVRTPDAGPTDGGTRVPAPAPAAPAPAVPPPAAPDLYNLVLRPGAVPSTPDHSASSPGPGGAAANRAGYTSATLGAHANADWDNLPANASGQIGLFVTRVNVEYTLDPITVAVSSDYAVGSCPYRVTLAHELEHAAAYLRIFTAARDSLRAALVAVPTPTRAAPRWVAPAAAGAEQDAWAAAFRAAVGRHRASVRAEMDADRDRRDAPSSYAAVYARCPAGEWQGTP